MVISAAIMLRITVLATASDGKPLGCWNFLPSTSSSGTVSNTCGRASPGQWDPSTGAVVDLGPAANHTGALMLFGNSSASPFHVPHSKAVDDLKEFTLAFWIDFFWLDPEDKKLCDMGDLISTLEFYDGFLKYKISGKEATPYPNRCGYLEPGTWHHVAVSKSHSSITLTVDGQVCPVASAVQKKTANKNDRLSKSHHNDRLSKSHHNDLQFGQWAGLLADVRLWDGPLHADSLANLYNRTRALYAHAAVSAPSRAQIARAGRGWQPAATPASAGALRLAWLNNSVEEDSSVLRSTQHIVWPGERHQAGYDPHPATRTAALELKAVLPWAKVVSVKSWTASGAKMSGRERLAGPVVVVCTCREYAAVFHTLRVTSSADVSPPCPLGDSSDESAFALQLNPNPAGGAPSLIVIGGGPAGMLYGAFAVVRHIRLHLPLTSAAFDTVQTPSTRVRLLNHWSNWRGFKADAWMAAPGNRSAPPPGGGGGAFCDGADRSDSLFSWSDLQNNSSNATTVIRAWARLLASVGINALAPQDVNWFEPNNFMQHLPEVKVLGDILRAFAIRLFWTPNYELAPQQQVADAVYEAVPDFGGYLLKVGSEGQGGLATPENINAIASLLARNASGETPGVVMVRGFIYGSKYGKKDRESVPAAFFGPFDGKYADNVYILGKYSALDYETSAPINAMDGLMQKTKYGPDVEVGKGFLMSWASRWEGWLGFNNWRGAGDSALRNREVTQGMLGVIIIGNGAAWTTNPLNMVNVFAFGRLSWNTSATTADIHSEWLRRTFGVGQASAAAAGIETILEMSERAADLLSLYRGYRGVWYKFEGDGLRSKPVNDQMLSKDGIGTPGDEAKELLGLYAPKLRAIYSNASHPLTQVGLLEFGNYKPSHQLTNGLTLLEDMKQRPVQGVNITVEMSRRWQAVRGAVDDRYWTLTNTEIELFIRQAQLQNERLQTALGKL